MFIEDLYGECVGVDDEPTIVTTAQKNRAIELVSDSKALLDKLYTAEAVSACAEVSTLVVSCVRSVANLISTADVAITFFAQFESTDNLEDMTPFVTLNREAKRKRGGQRKSSLDDSDSDLSCSSSSTKPKSPVAVDINNLTRKQVNYHNIIRIFFVVIMVLIVYVIQLYVIV